MFQLMTETAEDWWEVEGLYDLSFAPGREALSSYRLRENTDPVAELCMIARDEYGSVAGAIRYWPIVIGEGRAPALLLGPIAVHPTHQGEGLGGLLMRESLDIAKAAGWERVILVGDAPYYKRFGFEVALNLDFPPPVNPERVLCLSLVENAFACVTGSVQKAEK